MGTPLHTTAQTPPPPLPGATMHRLFLLFALLSPFFTDLQGQQQTTSTISPFQPQNISSTAQTKQQNYSVALTKQQTTSTIEVTPPYLLLVAARFSAVIVLSYCLHHVLSFFNFLEFLP